ncbi:MAG: hypothetical protein Rhirs2KO_20070 [Rhizobiaceae bacterium]
MAAYWLLRPPSRHWSARDDSTNGSGHTGGYENTNSKGLGAMKDSPGTSSSDRPDRGAHVFAIGQSVRLSHDIGRSAPRVTVYAIKGTLPLTGGFPRYRIRQRKRAR